MRTTLFPAHEACAGIYIHIPFCVRKCAYCDFLSSPAEKAVQEAYVNRLEQELIQVCHQMKAKKEVISTIYFGGGTPSILPGSQIERLLNVLREHGTILPEAEITLEMNPGTVLEEKLQSYSRAGINRLSIGAQSFQDEELKLLGRIHTSEDFKKTWRMARRLGFFNVSLDLMSGLPGQTAESWRSSLRTAVSMEPEHISAYSLIIEEGTPFYERYGNGWSEDNEELDRQMYEDTKRILEDAGYLRYEISNYARPGYESRHNTSYWTGIPYYGCGLGASSLIKRPEGWFRTRNQTVLKTYLHEGACYLEEERLTKQARMEEFMFLGLRLTEGIDIQEFDRRFASKEEKAGSSGLFYRIYGQVVQGLIKDGLMESKGTRLALTDRGLDLSNYCFEKFLL